MVIDRGEVYWRKAIRLYRGFYSEGSYLDLLQGITPAILSFHEFMMIVGYIFNRNARFSQAKSALFKFRFKTLLQDS